MCFVLVIQDFQLLQQSPILNLKGISQHRKLRGLKQQKLEHKATLVVMKREYLLIGHRSETVLFTNAPNVLRESDWKTSVGE